MVGTKYTYEYIKPALLFINPASKLFAVEIRFLNQTPNFFFVSKIMF